MGDFRHAQHHFAKQLLVLRLGMGERIKMGFGDEQQMHGRCGVDVFEAEHFVVFIHDAAGDLLDGDFAK